jgi:hypothetical protein
MLSPGQDHDLTCAEPLIEAVDPGALIADKAFDAPRISIRTIRIIMEDWTQTTFWRQPRESARASSLIGGRPLR